jgi:hypothetical protein
MVMFKTLFGKTCRILGSKIKYHWHFQFPTCSEIVNAFDLFLNGKLAKVIVEDK